MLYELRGVAGVEEDELPSGRRATRAATREELETMYGALEGGLHRIDFFKARKPEAVMRTLRTILSGTEIDQRESRLLAAIGYEIGNWIDRHLPDAGAEPEEGDAG